MQPFYFNGERAVFLAEDVSSALKQLDVSSSELDGIAVTAYSGEITLKNAKILTKSAEIQSVKGDVNADGEFSVADVVLLQKWLLAVPEIELADWKAADLCEDGVLNVFDLCMMKYELINES